MDFLNYIGPGLAVGLAGLGVAIGQGILAKASMEVIGKKSELNSFYLTITILGIALIESAVIYGFIVAFQILNINNFPLLASIGAGLSIGLTGLGAGIGEGKLIAGAIKAIDKNPEMRGKIMTFMVLFVALVESAAIYGLVVSFKIIGLDDITLASHINSLVGMGLAIGLAGLGVAVGEGILAERAMTAIGNKPKYSSLFLIITILGIALVESAAIYGLIVAFDIFNKNLGLLAGIGAGLSIGLAGLGAGIGEGKLVSGAIEAIEKKPEMKGKIMTFMVLFIALVESAAIYGLVVAFKILGSEGVSEGSILGMGLAIGLAGLGVAVGEGILAEKAMKVMGKKPKLSSLFLTITILGIALVESAAIYGLIVAFDIFSKNLGIMASVGAGLAIGLAGLGAGIGEGKLVSGAIEAIEKKPEMKGKIMTFMVLFIALVESAAIYGLVVAFKILGVESGDDATFMNSLIGMGMAIGFAGLGVAIGEGILAEKSMIAIGNRPKYSSLFLTITILGIALVESAAIYGLIVAFDIFNKHLGLLASIGAGLAIGLAGLGAGIGEGKLVSGAIEAIEKKPEMKGKIMTFMVLFIALVESAAIYGLVVAFKILGVEDPTITSFVGMGMAIGFAGLGVAIGEGILAEKAMLIIGRRTEYTSLFLTITILGIALVESAAIYGLVVAFGILDNNLGLYAAMGAGAAIGLTGLGAGIGEGTLISGALGSMERNPQLKGKMITFMVLFVALVEVTAIYGLIITFQIMGLEQVKSGFDSMIYLGAGLAIGIAGIGVAIGIGYLAEEAMIIIGKNSKMTNFLLTVSILGVALVESAVIYALIVSFQILTIENLSIYSALGAGFAIGFAGLGVGIGEGLLIKGAMKGINIAPQNKDKILAFMVLFVALVEVVAIYGLIIAFKVIGGE